MLFTRSLMISATDQYWSSGRKTCINYSHNLTSWDQSSANDAAVVHPFWLILLMQAFPNDVINGLHPFESHSRSRPLNHQAWGCAQIVLGTGLASSYLIPLENPTFHSSHTPWNTQPPKDIHLLIPNPIPRIYINEVIPKHKEYFWSYVLSLDGKMSQVFCSQ